MSTFWLSFVDTSPKARKGKRFLGVCIVRGSDPQEALATAKRLGCIPNPKKYRKVEMASLEVAPKHDARIGAEWRERLLSKQDCAAFDAALGMPPSVTGDRIIELADAGVIDVACPACVSGICAGNR